MIYSVIFLLAVSQPASTTGSSPEGYISDDSLESMPVSDIIDLVEREPGILNNGFRCGSLKYFSNTQSAHYIEFSTLNAGIEGNLHMRGGRVGEVAYLIDGFILRNPLTGGFISSIPLSSIRETSAVRGNFDVRYGNAQSGIVEIETLEGGNGYHGGISVICVY